MRNEVYVKYPIVDTAPRRDQLPALKDPKEKLNIWALLKDCIGQDLTKIALPGKNFHILKPQSLYK